MSEQKHTQGPWEIIENSWSTTTIRSGDTTIAVLSCEEEATEDNQFELEAIQKANARLMAAAPELLESATRVIKANFGGPSGRMEKAQAWDALEAAIAKATGR